MKFFLLLLLSVKLIAQAPSYMTITNGNFANSLGETVVSGVVTFTPTDGHSPISFKLGNGGQISKIPVKCYIANGNVTTSLAGGICRLPNVAITSPINVSFNTSWIDNVDSTKQLTSAGYSIQPKPNSYWCDYSNCNLNNFNPQIPNLPATTIGATGATGPAVAVTNGGVSGDYYVSGKLSNGSGNPPNLISDPTLPLQATTKQYNDNTRPGIWQRQGTILRGGFSNEWAVQEASFLHENNAKILSAPNNNVSAFLVYKMWYVCGWINEGLCYAESYDGISNWISLAAPLLPAPAAVAHMVVRKFGSIYVMYAANNGSNATAINRWTSSDGISWTLTNYSVIAQGGSGAWDDGPIGGIDVVQLPDGSYNAVYEASSIEYNVYQSGVATSPDGIHFTKFLGNPTIKGSNNGAAGGPDIHLINGIWYMWGQCSNTPTSEPTDMCRWHTSTFLSQWSLDGIVLRRKTRDEGPDRNDSLGGQVGGTRLIEVVGKDGAVRTFMYYVATRTQDTPTATNDGSHVKMAIANMSLAQVVATNEGDTEPTRAEMDYSQPSFYRRDYQGSPFEDDNGELAVGDVTVNGGGTPRICINCYQDINTSTARYVANGAAMILSLNKSNGSGSLNIYPVGNANDVIANESNLFNFSAQGVQVSRLNNFYGIQRATGSGCTPSSGVGNICGAQLTLPVPFPTASGSSGYTVFGCSIFGGNAGTTLGRINSSQTGTYFVVDEIAVLSGGGGGTINCLVMAN